MPIVIKPKKMMVSKDATKGGGGMDIATKRDALADKLSKVLRSATGAGRLSNRDIEKALRMGKERAMGERPKKAGGGKAIKKKKMMAKGGTAGGKKQMMMGGGKAKKMMKGGGKTKKYMAGGGRMKKMMAKGGAMGGKRKK